MFYVDNLCIDNGLDHMLSMTLSDKASDARKKLLSKTHYRDWKEAYSLGFRVLNLNDNPKD